MPKNHRTEERKTKKKPLKKPVSPTEKRPFKALMYKSRKESTLKIFKIRRFTKANDKTTNKIGKNVDSMRLKL